jgi:hypothetical protein
MLAVALGALVSFSAARSVAICLTVDSDLPAVNLPFKEHFPYGEAQEQARKAEAKSERRTIASMGPWRLIPLLVLAVAASFVFVAALRIRWASEGATSSTGILLANAALVSAVGRTIEGAQDLQIVNRSLEAHLNVLLTAKVPLIEAQAPYLQTLSSAFSVGVTIVGVTGFLVVSHYFRTPEVQTLLGVDDLDDD